MIELLGGGRFFWASDYPHMECAYPESVSTLLASTSLSPEVLNTVSWETPSRLYGVHTPTKG